MLTDETEIAKELSTAVAQENHEKQEEAATPPAELQMPEQPAPAAPSEEQQSAPPEPAALEPEQKPVRPPSVNQLANELSENPLSDDEEILKFIEESKPKVCVAGVGGSGSNTLDRLFDLGMSNMQLIGMNTDAHHLLTVKANKKVLLGKQLTRGRGAGSNPEIGLNAAKESAEEIKAAITGSSMVFITCGLGGGTGTGAAPLIAEISKGMGALTVAIVTLPFSSEGRIRMENALQGLEKLRKCTDTLIVIRNDKLLSIAPDLPLNTAFKVCDEVLAGSVKGIAELITCSGMMNVDFADLKTILSDAGYSVIGLGEASVDAKSDERSTIAIETALNSPLLDSEIQGANRALVNVVGGEDMTLKEAELIVAETAKRIHPNAHIIWGARIEEDLKKSSIKVLVVLGGVKFPKYGVQDRVPEGLEEIDLDVIG